MVSAKPGPRRTIEDLVEHLISVLDEIDGDVDFEIEPLEEQHDLEAADFVAGLASRAFVIAESARRQRVLRH